MRAMARKTFFVSAFVISFLFLSSQDILAQNPPPGQGPGAQAERYKYDVEKEKKRLEYKKPKAPKIEVEKEKVKPIVEGPSFILKEVNVTGSTIFKSQDFRKIYEPYLIQRGFLKRTASGRVLTERSYLHFGVKPPASGPQLF